MKMLLRALLCVATVGCARRETTEPAKRDPAAPAATREVHIAPINDPARSAREAAAAIHDPEQRLQAHERLLVKALADDPREAVAWVLGLEDKALAAVLLDQALAAWAEMDPRAAAAHVGALPESDYRAMLAGELAAAWAARDGAAATAWAAGLGDQEAREEALRGALGRVTESDPRRAAELALRATSEGDRAATLERVVESWWAKDAAAVEAWAAGLANGKEKELAERLVAARREAGAEAGR